MSESLHTRHTVVYVDDEELTRKYFARAAGGDYEVLLASGADEALSILRSESERITIFVTDYRMPGRLGDDLLRQIAREYPQIVRILVTAYADYDTLRDVATSGDAFCILEKPLGVGKLREALTSALTVLAARAR